MPQKRGVFASENGPLPPLYTDHAALMDKQVVLWRDTDKILGLFAAKKSCCTSKIPRFLKMELNWDADLNLSEAT
jgi:hypothetical protein